MKCPDCGAEIKTVLVEAFLTKKFVVDHDAKTITPEDGEPWNFDDTAYHCPNPECDSLNIDHDLKDYGFDEGSLMASL